MGKSWKKWKRLNKKAEAVEVAAAPVETQEVVATVAPKGTPKVRVTEKVATAAKKTTSGIKKKSTTSKTKRDATTS
jgi:hypothetical protein